MNGERRIGSRNLKADRGLLQCSSQLNNATYFYDRLPSFSGRTASQHLAFSHSFDDKIWQVAHDGRRYSTAISASILVEFWMFRVVSSDQGTDRKLTNWMSFVLTTVPFASIILVWFFQLRWPDVAVLFFAYLLLIPLTVALIWLRAGKGNTARREILFIGVYAALGVIAALMLLDQHHHNLLGDWDNHGCSTCHWIDDNLRSLFRAEP